MQEPNYERKFEQPTWKARTVSYDNWVIFTEFPVIHYCRSGAIGQICPCLKSILKTTHSRPLCIVNLQKICLFDIKIID